MTWMRSAYFLAAEADLSEKGAMPPGVWQPAHFSAKIGATSRQVGAAACDEGPVVLRDQPVRIAVATAAATSETTSAAPILLRCTTQS